MIQFKAVYLIILDFRIKMIKLVDCIEVAFRSKNTVVHLDSGGLMKCDLLLTLI